MVKAFTLSLNSRGYVLGASAKTAGLSAATAASSSASSSSSAASSAAASAVAAMSLIDLKLALASRGLPSSGTLQQLKDRLAAAMTAASSSSAVPQPASASAAGGTGGAGTKPTADAGKTASTSSEAGKQRGSTLSLTLLLDETLNPMPWEAMPVLAELQKQQQQQEQEERKGEDSKGRAGPAAASCSIVRLPCSSLMQPQPAQSGSTAVSADAAENDALSIRQHLLQRYCASLSFVPGTEGMSKAPSITAPSGFSPSFSPSFSFVVNPSGDLQSTQAALEPLLRGHLERALAASASPLSAEEQLKALSVAGRAPSSRRILGMLTHPDSLAYVYCGHGAGELYLPRSTLLTAATSPVFCPPALLMGCSSGQLLPSPDFCGELDGLPLALLLSGSPSVVGALWDVTDKDIDKFTEALLMQWLLPQEAGAAPGEGLAQSPAAGAGASKQGEKKAVVEKGKEKEQEKRKEGVDVTKPTALAAALVSSRSSCKLPSLTGFAAVCYGAVPLPAARLLMESALTPTATAARDGGKAAPAAAPATAPPPAAGKAAAPASRK